MSGPRIKRLLLLGLFLALAGVGWYAIRSGAIGWDALAEQQQTLQRMVAAHPVLAPVLYVALYATLVALSVPQGVVLTVAGGMLFGAVAGGALAVLGATIGATLLFLLARSAIGGLLPRPDQSTFGRLRAGLERDGFHYLLAIRLIPVFPFWLVNLGAAVGGVRPVAYVLATLIGIAPGTFVFASVGSGIGEVLAAGEEPAPRILLSATVLLPLIGLAALSLLPVLWRWWRPGRG